MSNYYDARQHLNLSEYALEIIENDKDIFLDKPSREKMLNIVFSMYRDYADASIRTACERYREQLEMQTGEVPDGSAKAATISALVKSYKADLIKKSTAYPREHTFKFQLDRGNYKYMADWSDTEEAYGEYGCRYIKAVLEEYSRKPYVEREAIICRDLIETVNACVESHLAMTITLNNGVRYEVRPYGVFVDRGNNYHYLVGYSRKARESEADKPSSFRISNIRDYKLYYGRSGKITQLQGKELEHRINSAGVQFLLQETNTIHIKLTKRGKSMYESQLHLRPPFSRCESDSNGDWIYEFNCTQRQVLYYFFKFGAEAEVLYPTELRNQFIRKYQIALDLYSEHTSSSDGTLT